MPFHVGDASTALLHARNPASAASDGPVGGGLFGGVPHLGGPVGVEVLRVQSG